MEIKEVKGYTEKDVKFIQETDKTVAMPAAKADTDAVRVKLILDKIDTTPLGDGVLYYKDSLALMLPEYYGKVVTAMEGLARGKLAGVKLETEKKKLLIRCEAANEIFSCVLE